MASNWLVVVAGLESLQQMDQESENIRINAVRAINTVARDSRVTASRRMQQLVNLPKSYFNPSAKRFYVSKQATRGDMTAVITAKARPTSLARYVTSGKLNQRGVTVSVTPGKTETMKTAFLIQLPAGKGPIDTASNMGLAIRLREGDSLTNKRYVKKMQKGLYLLYGPSIDQLFLARTGTRAGKGVATDMEPEILDDLEEQFLKLMGY